MEQFFVGAREPLFFMHIPKTAGTSMRRFLSDQYGESQTCPASDWSELIDLKQPIDSYPLIQGHFNISMRSFFPGRKSLTLLRNPLDRTLSALRHLKRDPNFHPLYKQAKDMTIGEMLADSRIFAMHQNAQTAYLSARTKGADVVELMRAGLARGERLDPGSLEDEPDLELAKSNLRAFEFVGLCEKLPEFLPMLSQGMDFHPVISFQKDNYAPDGLSNFHSLGADEIALLRQCNALDLELYNFAEQLIAERKAANPIEWSVATEVARLRDRGIYKPHTGSFEIDLAGPIPGFGWYSPERDGGTASRWTGPFRQFSLELPLRTDGQYQVTIGLFSKRAIDPSDFIVKANGQKVPTTCANDQNVYKITFEIPQAKLTQDDGICRLVFESPFTFQPASEGLPDQRTLGVLVNSLVFNYTP